MDIKDVYNRLLKKFGNQYWWPTISDNKFFEIVIGTILTQNTSWSNVEKVIKNLHREDLIDVEKMKKVDVKKLAGIIRSSGYHNQKAKSLKLIANFMSENDLSLLSLKEMRNRLLSLKGIGPETADSIILYAYKKPSFVVDAYTKRIFSRLGFIEKGASYDKVKQLFEDNLKKDTKLFQEYHALIVAHAKNICRKKPDCHKCPLEKNCKKLI